jgi:hypothetical protein
MENKTFRDNLIPNKNNEKKISFFGKMKNLYKEVESNLQETIKEMNLPEIKKTLSDQTKVAAVAFKEFSIDISRDFKVFVI